MYEGLKKNVTKNKLLLKKHKFWYTKFLQIIIKQIIINFRQ